jgi:hypothetical protein
LDERDPIDERIARFSLSALGYDPERDAEPPRVVLDWARQQKKSQEAWRKLFGAAVIAVLAAVTGGVVWPLMQELRKWFGH